MANRCAVLFTYGLFLWRAAATAQDGGESFETDFAMTCLPSITVPFPAKSCAFCL